MPKTINTRLDNIEDDILFFNEKIRKKEKKNHRIRSSCPASSENVPKPRLSSVSVLSRSMSAPSKMDVREKNHSDLTISSHKSRTKKTRVPKPRGRSTSPIKTSNTVLKYIQDLEEGMKPLQEIYDANYTKKSDSDLSKLSASDSSKYPQTVHCANVLVQHKFNDPRTFKSTKNIKKDIEKIKMQLTELEESKRTALETTKKVIYKHEMPKKRRSCSRKTSETVTAATPNIAVRISPKQSNHNQSDEIMKRDETIKSLKDGNRMLHDNLAQLEKNNSYLTESLRGAQSQLRDNRKSFLKYANVLKENVNLTAELKQRETIAKKKDEANTKIFKAAEELAKDLSEKDELNIRLCDNVDQLKNALVETGRLNKNLTETNAELAKNMQEREAEFAETKNKYEIVQKQIEVFKSQMKKSQSEINHMRQMVQDKEKYDSSKSKIELEEKVRGFRAREEELLGQCGFLTKQLQELRNEKETSANSYSDKVQKLNRDIKNSESIITELKQKVIQYEQMEKKSRVDAAVLEELMNFKKKMFNNEKNTCNEKEELTSLVQELTDMVKRQKETIIGLTEFNKQQEQVMEIQKHAILTKEKEINETKAEVKCMQSKCSELQIQTNFLQHSLGSLQSRKCEHEANVSESHVNLLVKKLDETKISLEKEKEMVAIKMKIIDDQSRTIQQLKMDISDRNQEIKRADMDLRKMVMELTSSAEQFDRINMELEEEKREKEAMFVDITNLKTCKEYLVQQFEELEAAFSQYCQRVNPAGARQQEEVIKVLKQQVERKHNEWEAHTKNLIKEKEKAIEAAKFATQKLVDTVQDFQNQVDSHHNVQRMLTKLLHEKDEKIKNTLIKMSSMTFDLAKNHSSFASNKKLGDGENCDKENEKGVDLHVDDSFEQQLARLQDDGKNKEFALLSVSGEDSCRIKSIESFVVPHEVLTRCSLNWQAFMNDDPIAMSHVSISEISEHDSRRKKQNLQVSSSWPNEDKETRSILPRKVFDAAKRHQYVSRGPISQKSTPALQMEQQNYLHAYDEIDDSEEEMRNPPLAMKLPEQQVYWSTQEQYLKSLDSPAPKSETASEIRYFSLIRGHSKPHSKYYYSRT